MCRTSSLLTITIAFDSPAYLSVIFHVTTPPALPPRCLSAAEPSKPNILCIIADDLATRLGCYGNKAAMNPHLDRLASEGVVFTKAYCQGRSARPAARRSCSG